MNKLFIEVLKLNYSKMHLKIAIVAGFDGSHPLIPAHRRSMQRQEVLCESQASLVYI